MVDKVGKINQKLRGWSQFYRHTDFIGMPYGRMDRVVFWKLALWLARKYKCQFRALLKKWCKPPEPKKTKAWVLFGKTNQGHMCGVSLFRLVSSQKMPFKWRLPATNPYLLTEARNTVTSRYSHVAKAVGLDLAESRMR
ncbi:group II intron maturase-specific domain-containing protein [Vibrio sp.]|uniref:group II intron maturase-specific domain-containing protein n=1 Tax=Vibrio sp. TaxID=678 RepID=UPI0037DCAF4A